jgi:hypothetical protein
MDKNTSYLTKNTALEHKFHFDMRKWQTRQNSGQMTILLAKNLLYLAKNIEEMA